ncbi:transmembrane protein 170A [Callorhinchus milii]|uniref:Transmembrane protein 170A n=1 Tax=Callorhinchus milii TaxID=7868 RepID=V9KLK9_CALMI|nr:transmembrane protein 170A [Callorhinchus milii]|eukprot:gi/632944798/ref/XP_007887698.1/ PREDICTED: transmembrane protein 170A [Callorhinchus milii]
MHSAGSFSVQQILSLGLIPRAGNATCPRNITTSLCEFSEMWYGVFLWALLSSVFIYVPAGLLGFVMLRHHKYGRFISLGIIGGILGPIIAAVLTSAAIAGVYRAAAKQMVPLEALVLGIGQIFFVVAIAFLRILATL